MKVNATTGVFAVVGMALLCETGFATLQSLERLHYHGLNTVVCERPLAYVWASPGAGPSFDETRTSNRKGYSATWEIRDSKPFLISFEAKIQGRRVPIHQILPGRRLPVHADWYTGRLHVPLGEWVTAPGGSRPKWERLLVLEVEKGIIVSSVEKRNALPEGR